MKSEMRENLKNGKAKEMMGTFSGKSKELSIKARENLVRNIVKHPLRSIGIAAVTGYLAAFVLRKKQK